MCQEMSMVMATEAYKINKSKTGHPVGILRDSLELRIGTTELLTRKASDFQESFELLGFPWSSMTNRDCQSFSWKNF